MNSTPRYLGIDISKEYFDVSLLSDGHYLSATFKNNKKGFYQLRRWLKKRGVTNLHACMEATGRYGEALALFLYQEGYTVSVPQGEAKRSGQSFSYQSLRSQPTEAKQE